MKIAVLTLADDNYAEIMDITNDNHYEYAVRNGYHYIEFHNTLDETRPTSWSKLLFVKRELPYYDWVLWADADTVFMNWSIKLESIVDDNYSQIFPKDDENGISCGVFLFKNDRTSFDLIVDAWIHTQFVNHRWWEQAAIQHIAHKYASIKTVPMRVLSSHPRLGAVYQEGDFLIHYSGSGMNCEYVREGLKKHVELAIQKNKL